MPVACSRRGSADLDRRSLARCPLGTLLPKYFEFGLK